MTNQIFGVAFRRRPTLEGLAGAAGYTARLISGRPRLLICEMPDGEGCELPGDGSCGKRAVRNPAFAQHHQLVQEPWLGQSCRWATARAGPQDFAPSASETSHALGALEQQFQQMESRRSPRSRQARGKFASRAFRGKGRDHLKAWSRLQKHGAGRDAGPLLGALFYVLLSYRVPRGSTRSGKAVQPRHKDLHLRPS